MIFFVVVLGSRRRHSSSDRTGFVELQNAVPLDQPAVVQVLLVSYAIAFTLAVGAPLAITPLAWARLIGWSIGDDPKLAIYFGRCLGAVIVAVSAVAVRVSGDPVVAPHLLDIIILAFAGMTAVHAWGWFRRIQPLVENLETFLYLALFAVSLWFRLHAAA